MNEMNQFIVDELKKALVANEGDEEKTNAIRDLINSINGNLVSSPDDINIPVEVKVTLKKYDGEKKEGDEPVETIIFE